MSNDNPTLDEFDLTLGMNFSLEPGDIHDIAADLEESEDYDAQGADSETLAEFAAALKRLSDAAEDARKDVFEAELDDRTSVNEEVGPLVKRQGSRSFVADETGAIDAIEDAGADPREAMTLKASLAADLLESHGIDPDEYIGVTEYEYFRRRP